MTATAPLRPDLADDLIARYEQATERWARLVRNQLDAIHIGQSRHADHANAAVLKRILADHDWPGLQLVGPDAAQAAWRIALHADHAPDFQRTAAQLLDRAVQADDAPVQQWAHLHDRALVNSGQAQEFGTQYRTGPGGLEPYPVREPALLDDRRASVGLQPAATALHALRQRLASAPGHGDTTGDIVVPARSAVPVERRLWQLKPRRHIRPVPEATPDQVSAGELRAVGQ
ncbi:DUF6624 domain-containing protein [Streptomyces sp. NBC_00654]|uniref:DUF6624 domain-containing protein n=1 Tax=Streptomyces sp. NBC_00654 TaxID=2975799 RepID=UPI002B1DE855|nr:DUF6624 domain-containing protein [Streptomyces sp. NBC_00654]